MKTLTFTIKGTLPMLMHNSQLASPLNAYAKQLKQVSSKRTKTDEDHESMALIEARGGLYYNDVDGIHVPGENIEATILGAAKLQKLGTTLKRGARVVDINCPLVYDGPTDPDELIRTDGFLFAKLVKVGQARVLRTRPIFNNWSLTFTIAYAPEHLNQETIIDLVKNSGELVGLGDWRPRFGLFSVESVEG